MVDLRSFFTCEEVACWHFLKDQWERDQSHDEVEGGYWISLEDSSFDKYWAKWVFAKKQVDFTLSNDQQK